MFSCEYFESFCMLVVGVQIVCGVLRYLYQNLYGPYYGKQINFKSYGKWALVTGATDGIGKEYAIQLAKKGLNIILVSRTLSKLESVAKEIQETFGVETAVIDVDFTSSDIYDKIKDRIKGKEIGILVNNVGMCYSTPDFFLAIPEREKFIKDLVNCNILSMAMMCSIILPQMVQRKRGIIINLGSMSSAVPAANYCVYSGSKAFVDKFSDDLSAEYEQSGIIVQSVLPGPVATNMTKQKEATFMFPTPDQFVESALATVGYAGHTNAFVWHMLLQLVAQLVSFVAPSISRKLTLKAIEDRRNQHIREGLYTPAKN